MPDNELEFSRHVDLPPIIVWDALVDVDLVEGWLAAAIIDGRVGGRYELTWLTGGDFPPAIGIITAFDAPRRLVIETDTSGTIDFSLTAVAGGSRGTSTDLAVRLTVRTDRRMLASTIAHWRNNLDQLEELLHGHPVIWETWGESRGLVWRRYLRAAQNAD